MGNILDNEGFNMDGSFLSMRPLIESYFNQEIKNFDEFYNLNNKLMHSIMGRMMGLYELIDINRFIEKYGFSSHLISFMEDYEFYFEPFILINNFLISEFKSFPYNSTDVSYDNSYGGLDNLFSINNISHDFNKNSPFFPGMPADPNGFKGRIDTSNHILRYFSNVFSGRCQHFYLTGKRRIGKTSLINFLKDYMGSYGVASIYVSNKGNDSVEFLTKNIVESLLYELAADDSNISQRLKNFFKDHIDSIEFKGTKISLKTDEFLSLSFKDDLINHLISIFNEFGKDRKALFIIIDDINGLSDSKEFVHWYKKLADTIAVSYMGQLPVYFLLASYPEKFFALSKQEPSFGTIFEYENIDKLSDNEVRYFFMSLFKSIDLEIDEDALFLMVLFSMGQPLMMQLIGDSIYWNCHENIINNENAIKGIIEASNQLKTKYLKDVLSMVFEENYNLIIESLISNGKYYFTKSDIKKLDILDKSDGFIDNFISKMLDADSIEVLDYSNSSIFNLRSFNNPGLISSAFNLDNFDFSENIYSFDGSLTFIYFWIKYIESYI